MHFLIELDATERQNLIELNVAVDLAHEEVAAGVSNSTGHDEEDDRHHQRVTKVPHNGSERGNVQVREVEDRVAEHVNGRSTASQVRSPPPVIVL